MGYCPQASKESEVTQYAHMHLKAEVRELFPKGNSKVLWGYTIPVATTQFSHWCGKQLLNNNRASFDKYKHGDSLSTPILEYT